MQTSELCVMLWQAIAAHTCQLQRLGRIPAIIWGGFGMPEENIFGIVCGTSDVCRVGRVHVMAVLKMLTADWVACVEVLEIRFRANLSPCSVYDQFLGPVKARMLLLNPFVSGFFLILRL